MRFETFLFFLVSSLAVMFLIWGLEAQPLVMVPVLLASMFSGGRGFTEPPGKRKLLAAAERR
jgi:hypothetical protein